jgi:hypothetical protein
MIRTDEIWLATLVQGLPWHRLGAAGAISVL